MKFRLGIFLLLFAWGAVASRAVVFNLVAPPDVVAPGSAVTLNLLILNPDAGEVTLDVPETLSAKLSNDKHDWSVQLKASAVNGSVTVKPGGFAVQEYEFELPKSARDQLVLSISVPTAAKVVFEAREQAAVVKTRPPLSNFTPQRTAEATIRRTFENRFSVHEPIYFIYGNESQGAKFQFSFKYRVLGEHAGLGDQIPALRSLYFGYTQRSLWDINGDSSPFYDTSYLPEIMFQSQKVIDPATPGGFKWMGYQAGVRHESNGRDGLNSRSLNIAYFRPGFAFGRLDGWNVIIAPRLFTYVSDLSNNPDIKDYRGNLELLTVLGKNDGPMLSLTSRLGRKSGKGSVQADLTFPVKFDRMFDFATYVLIQYWDGYGESLLDYNTKSQAVRIGFSLVR